MFSVVARLGVGAETRDAGVLGADGAGFGAEEDVGLLGVWLLRFWVVEVIVRLVEGESWVSCRLALEVYGTFVAIWKVSIAFQGRILRGADILDIVDG
jgi:hypothetical protein